MSYQEMYLQTTGNDCNAGSTNADAASVTETNGDWGNAAANRFTAASGTPFSGVSVGEWASIFLDAATSAVYVARVTAVDAGGTYIDLSTTDKYGTAPTTGATGRSCKIGGAWASLAIASLFTGGSIPFGTRINVKAGTYANSTTARTFASDGLATGPLWFRGYTTTPGDLDELVYDPTNRPSWTWGSAALTLNVDHLILTNVNISGARSGQSQVVGNGSYWDIDRCRIENTAAHASSAAFAPSGLYVSITRSYLKATTTAGGVLGIPTICVLHGTTIEGGLTAFNPGNNNRVAASYCIFHNQVNDAVTISSAGGVSFADFTHCLFNNPGRDGIRFTTGAAWFAKVANCMFRKIAGNCLNNTSGGNITSVVRLANAYYSVTGSLESGFGDHPAFTPWVQETSDPYTSDSDLSLVTGANSKGAGEPGIFENMGITGYPDIGHHQRQETGGGSGPVPKFGPSGEGPSFKGVLA